VLQRSTRTRSPALARRHFARLKIVTRHVRGHGTECILHTGTECIIRDVYPAYGHRVYHSRPRISSPERISWLRLVCHFSNGGGLRLRSRARACMVC